MQTLERPGTLTELFLHYQPGMMFVAGGTDWIIKNRECLPEDAAVADLSQIGEMKGISFDGKYLRIGALETMTALTKNETVRRYASSIADAACAMGSEQIRNRATVGGNVANSSPAADMPPALAALDAEAVVVSGCSERRVSVEEIADPAINSLLTGEVIKEFSIPIDGERRSAFLKVGSRSQVSISRVNIALSARPEGKLYKEARVYIGTLAAAARRCVAAEAALALSGFGESFTDALLTLASEAIPGRHTLPYKKSALRALAHDICILLASRSTSADG